MRTTHHSEYLKIESLFIKSAEHAFVSPVHLSEQWQDLNYLSEPEFDASIAEYAAFEKSLSNNGIETHHFPLDDTVTMDSIYCRDASIATDFGMIICNMGSREGSMNPRPKGRCFLRRIFPF